jgi:two-component system invasion response regulator UvrY
MNSLPTISIAVVDDHILIAKALADFINSMDGFKADIVAYHGKDLLYKIAMSLHQPDICILDIVMPEMDGYETVLALKVKYPFIKTLALTTVHSDYAILKMLQIGACGYLMKTTHPEEFKKALMDTYIQGYYFSSDVLEKFPKISSSKKKEEYFETLFTEQEIKFLSLCCSSMTYKQIGHEMNLSHRTAEHYGNRLEQKLGLRSRAELAMYALNAGIGKFNHQRLI